MVHKMSTTDPLKSKKTFNISVSVFAVSRIFWHGVVFACAALMNAPELEKLFVKSASPEAVLFVLADVVLQLGLRQHGAPGNLLRQAHEQTTWDPENTTWAPRARRLKRVHWRSSSHLERRLLQCWAQDSPPGERTLIKWFASTHTDLMKTRCPLSVR